LLKVNNVLVSGITLITNLLNAFSLGFQIHEVMAGAAQSCKELIDNVPGGLVRVAVIECRQQLTLILPDT
jgi:hypothetical protein